MKPLKILIFVSPRADAVAVNHELTTGLAHSLSQRAEVDLRTSLHGIGSEMLSNYDIIHIFGCWNTAVIQLQHTAYKLHIPTVYTLLGGLQPWNIKNRKPTCGYKRQKNAIQKASAIHLCSKLECDTFSSLGWNQRWMLVMNPVLTNQLTFAEMGDRMSLLYRKILDTQARLLLSPDSKQAVGDLLQLGTDRDVLIDQPRCASIKELLNKLTDTDWRRIMIYADDENIIEPIETAFERINFTPPEINTEAIDRFTIHQSYPAGMLQDDELCFKSTSLISKLESLLKDHEVNERKLCIELLNLKHETEHHTAPLLHLANIYATLRFCDMDEDRMNDIVNELGLADFASRLMTVMHDLLNLTEGFMPFRPKDDRATQQLKSNITKFNTWA